MGADHHQDDLLDRRRDVHRDLPVHRGHHQGAGHRNHPDADHQDHRGAGHRNHPDADHPWGADQWGADHPRNHPDADQPDAGHRAAAAPDGPTAPWGDQAAGVPDDPTDSSVAAGPAEPAEQCGRPEQPAREPESAALPPDAGRPVAGDRE